MTIEEAFETLRKKNGNHSAAARALSINISHYRDLRNGRANITPRMKDFLLLKAGEILSEQAHPTSGEAQEA